MKMTVLIAAAGIALGAFAPLAPAAAQTHVRTVVHERTVVRHGGPRYRHRAHRPQRVCTWKYRHHHRVRVCRTVYR
jgi:hypothetical protein